MTWMYESELKMSEYKDFINYLKGYQIHPNKSLGQNFLVAGQDLTNLVNEIKLVEDSFILEIGTGTGNLTAVLAEKAKEVVTIEIDQHLTRALQDRFASYPNVKLVQADALQLSRYPGVQEAREEGRPIYVVGNLPYYITTKLIAHLLVHLPDAFAYSFLIQKEFSDRMRAPVGTKDYGPLNILMDNLTDCRIGSTFGAHAFYPAPQVQSLVLHLQNKADILPAEASRRDYYLFLKESFAQRRKMFNKAFPRLQVGWPKLKEWTVQEWLEQAGVSWQARPEQIQLTQWQILYQSASQ